MSGWVNSEEWERQNAERTLVFALMTQLLDINERLPQAAVDALLGLSTDSHEGPDQPD